MSVASHFGHTIAQIRFMDPMRALERQAVGTGLIFLAGITSTLGVVKPGEIWHHLEIVPILSPVIRPIEHSEGTLLDCVHMLAIKECLALPLR